MKCPESPLYCYIENAKEALRAVCPYQERWCDVRLLCPLYEGRALHFNVNLNKRTGRRSGKSPTDNPHKVFYELKYLRLVHDRCDL